MTREQQLLQDFVDAYEGLMETNGAQKFMDLSETFRVSNWLAGGFLKPYEAGKQFLTGELTPETQQRLTRTLEARTPEERVWLEKEKNKIVHENSI